MVVPAPTQIGAGILSHIADADQGIVSYPALTPHLRFHEIGDQQTLLVSETFNTLLGGKLTSELLPLLDGKRSLDQITQALSDRYTATAIQAGLNSLSSKGYIVSGDHDMDASQAAYWSSLGASPRFAQDQLAASRVEILGESSDQFEAQLQTAGITVDHDNPELVIVVCSDYLEDRLFDINRKHLEQGRPWLLVRPQGIQPLFGPVFRADGTGPCWLCLRDRMRNHQDVHSFLKSYAGEVSAFRPFARHSLVFPALISLISAEIAKWVVLRQASVLNDHAIEVNTATLQTSKHLVTHRPQCQACGDEALFRPDRQPTPLRLEASPKTFRTSSGSRTVSPQVTLAKYRHIVSPISGVVTWLTRTTDETDAWLHVYWAGSNLAVRNRSLSSLRRSLRSKSAGKGSTREQSEVSALCEAVERYSGAAHGEEIRRLTTYESLCRDDDAIHPNEIQLFSESQLENADSINAEGHPYNLVPPRFDPSVSVHWTPVWSLTQDRHRYLPTSMLYSMSAEQRGPNDLIADSNGCAAGNTVEEAILQGFYELVERDAFAIWWYNQLRMPEVALESFDDEFLNSAKDYYADYERNIWLLDITADISIPTFVALSNRPDGVSEDIIYGAGSHADPRIAAQRAICELNQCLTWLPRPGSRDGRPMVDDPMALTWWRTARLADCEWLAPSTTEPTRTNLDYPVIEADDSRDDVEYCRSLVESKGLEFLVLDQTRPDIGMPVVRVMVPGMRHFWERFAPGRLFTVPITTGHRHQPLDESELNPTPVIA